MPHFEEPDGFQRAVSNAADRLAGDYSNEQYGLAPKLWTHLKRATMRKEVREALLTRHGSFVCLRTAHN